jgi:hypothetical protein
MLQPVSLAQQEKAETPSEFDAWPFFVFAHA